MKDRNKEGVDKLVSEQKGKAAVGYQPSAEVIIMDATPAESESLENLFTEIDAIDARIVKYQEETRTLEHENRKVLSELEAIVARL